MRITRAYGATQEIEENPIVSPYFVIFHIISSFMRMKSKKISLLTQYYYLFPRFVELPPPLTVKLKAAENNSNPADIINCEWDSILKQHYFQLVCDKDISNPRPKSGITPIVPGPVPLTRSVTITTCHAACHNCDACRASSGGPGADGV